MDLALKGAGTYAVERQRVRAKRRDAANARAVTIVKGEVTFARASGGVRASARATIGPAIGSIALHAAVVLTALMMRPSDAARAPSYDAPVHVVMTEPPAAMPPEIPVAAPTLAPPPKAPVVSKPAATKVAEPPPDPIDLSPPPPTLEPPKPSARRIVGIDMESTTTAGEGVAFAVGNTRMGETAQVAQDPNAVETLAPSFTPVKRTRAPAPEYPALLRAAGIEGDVGLHVEIDASGNVTHVTVSAPSDHAEFNRAAEAAAAASTYESAKVNGVGVARAIDFTVRFRLHS